MPLFCRTRVAVLLFVVPTLLFQALTLKNADFSATRFDRLDDEAAAVKLIMGFQSSQAPADMVHHCAGVLKGRGPMTLPGQGFPSNNETKYVIFYPRAGLGNVMAGFVSTVMYACLTNRTFKIAPIYEREVVYNKALRDVYAPYEMDLELVRQYQQSQTPVLKPEGWTERLCQENRQDLVQVLCDDATATQHQRFVSMSACQYFGDQLRFNPHFRHLLTETPYRNVLRSLFQPSAEISSQIITGGPYDVCIHVRWGLDHLSNPLHEWLESLESCVNGLLPSGGNAPSENHHEVNSGSSLSSLVLFTMHEDMRQAIRGHFLCNATTQRHVMFASTTHPTGALGLANDALTAVADVFSMGTQCRAILASHPKSTYVSLAVNLMKEPRLHPAETWSNNVCRFDRPPPMASSEPTSDSWEPIDHCGLKSVRCPADESPEERRADGSNHQTAKSTVMIAKEQLPFL